jgi:tetratricopeptide (TPR) repeat protein
MPGPPPPLLPVKRTYVKFILLNLLTLGIYKQYYYACCIREMNAACAEDGEETPGFWKYFGLSLLTFGIYGIIHQVQLMKRVENAGKRYGVKVMSAGKKMAMQYGGILGVGFLEGILSVLVPLIVLGARIYDPASVLLLTVILMLAGTLPGFILIFISSYHWIHDFNAISRAYNQRVQTGWAPSPARIPAGPIYAAPAPPVSANAAPAPSAPLASAPPQPAKPSAGEKLSQAAVHARQIGFALWEAAKPRLQSFRQAVRQTAAAAWIWIKRHKKPVIAALAALTAVAALCVTGGLVWQARQAKKAALNTAPDSPLVLGEKYLTELDYEQALPQFDEAIRIDPKNPRSYLGKADALLHLDRQPDAAEALAKGAQKTGDPLLTAAETAAGQSAADGYVAISNAYEKLNWGDIALGLLRRVAKELPDEAKIIAALERLEELFGETSRARWEKAYASVLGTLREIVVSRDWDALAAEFSPDVTLNYELDTTSFGYVFHDLNKDCVAELILSCRQQGDDVPTIRAIYVLEKNNPVQLWTDMYRMGGSFQSSGAFLEENYAGSGMRTTQRLLLKNNQLVFDKAIESPMWDMPQEYRYYEGSFDNGIVISEAKYNELQKTEFRGGAEAKFAFFPIEDYRPNAAEEQAYANVLGLYQDIAASGRPGRFESEMQASLGVLEDAACYYAFQDIDSNGVTELLMIKKNNYYDGTTRSSIFGAYTLVGGKPQAMHLRENSTYPECYWASYDGYLDGSGFLYVSGYGSNTSFNFKLRISNHDFVCAASYIAGGWASGDPSYDGDCHNQQEYDSGIKNWPKDNAKAGLTCYPIEDYRPAAEETERNTTAAVTLDPSWVIAPAYTAAHPFSEGLAAVSKSAESSSGGKWGFIDEKGTLVIPMIYGEVGDFSDGLALIAIGEYPNTKYGYIDKTGKTVIPAIYDNARPFSEGLAAVAIGKTELLEYPKMHNTYGKMGYINTQGKTVIPFEYAWNVMAENYDFSEGLAAVSKRMDNLSSYSWSFGYIDKTGKQVIPFEYNEARPFSDGLALVTKAAVSNYGYIDKTGKTVLPFQYQELQTGGDFKNGLAAVENGDGKIGYMDKTGKMAIPFQLTSTSPQAPGYASSFVGGYAYASIIQNDRKVDGFIDKTGKFTSYQSLFGSLPYYSEFLSSEVFGGKITHTDGPLMPLLDIQGAEEDEYFGSSFPVGKYGYIKNPFYH